MAEDLRELRVVRTATGEVVHRVDVTGRPDRWVERCLSGMLRNMNRDEYHVQDTASERSGEAPASASPVPASASRRSS